MFSECKDIIHQIFTITTHWTVRAEAQSVNQQGCPHGNYAPGMRKIPIYHFRISLKNYVTENVDHNV